MEHSRTSSDPIEAVHCHKYPALPNKDWYVHKITNKKGSPSTFRKNKCWLTTNKQQKPNGVWCISYRNWPKTTRTKSDQRATSDTYISTNGGNPNRRTTDPCHTASRKSALTKIDATIGTQAPSSYSSQSESSPYAFKNPDLDGSPLMAADSLINHMCGLRTCDNRGVCLKVGILDSTKWVNFWTCLSNQELSHTDWVIVSWPENSFPVF